MEKLTKKLNFLVKIFCKIGHNKRPRYIITHIHKNISDKSLKIFTYIVSETIL